MNDSAKSILLVLGALLLIIVIGTIARHETKNNKDEPKAPVPMSKKHHLIYVTSKRCSWCDKMDRDTLSSDKVKDRLDREFVFHKKTSKDMQYKGNDAFVPFNGQLYKVTGFPTTILLNHDGKELRNTAGYMGPDEFLHWLDHKREGKGDGFSPVGEVP
jgi:thioredoxin-related protein